VIAQPARLLGVVVSTERGCSVVIRSRLPAAHSDDPLDGDLTHARVSQCRALLVVGDLPLAWD